MANTPIVTAGPFPWKQQKKRYDEKQGFQFNVGVQAIAGRTANGRARKNKSGRTEATTSGWVVLQTPNEYSQNPTKPEMVELRVYNGRRSLVPIGDTQQFIGFSRMDPALVPDAMAQQVVAAFQKESGRGRYYEFDGVGHIAHVRYNPSQQIMEVSFVNRGDICTFFRVPSNLYGEFEHLASSNATQLGMDGTRRHSLGIRFWDEVRIRGQRENARYPFVYASGSNITAGANAQSGYVGDMYKIEANQPAVDARREATITHQEESVDELREAIQGGRFLPVQVERINSMRDLLADKFKGVTNSPAQREFASAVESGDWGRILQIAKLYKLY
jgi:hypothetical protein